MLKRELHGMLVSPWTVLGRESRVVTLMGHRSTRMVREVYGRGPKVYRGPRPTFAGLDVSRLLCPSDTLPEVIDIHTRLKR